MRLVTYLTILATLGAISHLINIVEKTHKHAPALLKKVSLAGPFIQRALNPITIALLVYVGLVTLFINFNTLDAQMMQSANLQFFPDTISGFPF